MCVPVLSRMNPPYHHSIHQHELLDKEITAVLVIRKHVGHTFPIGNRCSFSIVFLSQLANIAVDSLGTSQEVGVTR